MTSPSAESDLLIACASFSVSPDAPDFFTLRRMLQPVSSFHEQSTRSILVEGQLRDLMVPCGAPSFESSCEPLYSGLSAQAHRSEPARSTKLSFPFVTF